MNKKIAIVVGHASDVQGNVRLGVSEFKFWSEFVEDIIAPSVVELFPDNYRIFYRPKQRRIGYHKAVRILHREIDAWGADIDIELHYNGTSKHNVNGHEVIYSGSKKSLQYAKQLDEYFDKYLPNRDRGIKRVLTRGAYGLKVGKSASIISEAFFGQELRHFLPEGAYRANLIKSLVEFLLGLQR